MSGAGSWEGWDAWKKTDGWKKNDSGLSPGGGDEPLATLVDGLIRNREALKTGIPPDVQRQGQVLAPSKAKPRTAAVAPAAGQVVLDLPAELGACGPDVRMKVLLMELLQGLHFSAQVDGQVQSACISLGGKAGAPLVAKITRPDAEVFEKQAVEVSKWAARRAERTPEILSQVGPQMAYWSAIVNLSPERTPRTLEFCSIAMTFASFVVQRVKQILACKRPLAYDLTLQPMIPTPAFSAMPSGHATEAFMMAHLLERLCNFEGEGAKLLQRQADRIATNRVIAGLHFPVDSIAGRMLGQTLAEYLLHRSIATEWTSRTFLGHEVAGESQFRYDEDMNRYRSTCFRSKPGKAAGQSPLLFWLWERCQGGNA